MDARTSAEIQDILKDHSYLSLATIRPDGYPQATTVGYVNDGLTLYIGAAADSQKVRNIGRCNKVSLTIDREEDDWSRIRGLSMGATAEVVHDPAELARATDLMLAKFPQIKELAAPELGSFVLVKITPQVISVLDYRKGFGHTELVTV